MAHGHSVSEQHIVVTDSADSGEVLAHLEEVLNSPAFRSSPRSRQFLQYVMTNTLEGRHDLLKERLIGERIFGRPPHYDTGQDSIVRVKANEVRRRLAQFYDLHPHSPIRIDLPAGSYTAHVRSVAEADPAASRLPAERRKAKWRWLLAGLIAVVTGAAAAIFLPPLRAQSPFALFWEPFLTGTKDLMLCIPTPDAYRIYGAGRDSLVSALRPRAPGEPPPRLALSSLGDVKIIPEPGLFVGLGDARAITLVHSFAVSHGNTPKLRIGSATTFTELRAGPSVLIGGVSNRWTLDLMRDHRFSFIQEERRYSIRDNRTNQMICTKPASWEPVSNDDCALVTRVMDSKTGHPVMIAAGLDHFGTFVVGEFLTRPELLEPALRSAPRAWESKNLQIVFRVERVGVERAGDNMGPPKLLAVHTW